MELRPRKGRNSSVSASASKLPPPAASATPSAAPSPLSKISQSGVPSRAKKKATPRRSHGPLDEEYKCTAQTERAPGFMNGDGALAKGQEAGYADVGTPPSSMAKSRAAQGTSQKATKDKSNLRATPAIAHIGTSPVVAVAEMENGVIQSAARTEDRRNSSSKKASRRRDATKQNLSDKVQTVSSDSECGRIQDNAVSPSMYTAVPVDERNLAPSFLKECTETETSLKQTPPIVSEVDVELSRIKYRNLNEEFSASLKQFSDASLQGTPSEDLENSQCNSLLVVALQTPGLSVGDRLQAVSSQKEWFSVGQTVEAKKEEGLTDGVNYCNGGEKTSVSGRKEAPCIGDKESLLLEVSAHSERGEPNMAFASRKKQEIYVEAKVNLGQNGEAEDRRQNTREIFIDEDAEGSGGDDDDEAEEEAAKAFISCMKAHLQPNSRISMPAGKSQENSFGGKPTAIVKEVQGMASNHHRLVALGLSWSPQTGLPPAKCRNASSSSHNNSSKGPETFWKKEQKLQDGLLMPPVDPSKLNKLARMHKEKSAGEKWYNLSAPTITPELKKDLQLLKLRRVVDPKRHYKADDSKGLPKHFQVGTVVGGAADFYSGRLTKKEQKSTLADELLADSAVSAYRKRKYLEIQKQQQSGGKAYFKKKKSKRTPSWARI